MGKFSNPAHPGKLFVNVFKLLFFIFSTTFKILIFYPIQIRREHMYLSTKNV